MTFPMTKINICKISITDRIVIGIILHEIRKEFGYPISFYQESKRGGNNINALPRQIAYYLSKSFCATTTQLSISKFFKTSNSNFIQAIQKIDERINENRTFQYLMRRISDKTEARIKEIYERNSKI